MECGRRPNRSDVHLSREEEAKIEEETREHFDNLAPKRHTKPQRSEYSSRYVDAFANNDSNKEYVEFQRLQENDSPHQKLIYNRSQVTEEFQETEYYKDLNCIDKQHHTTGTGFIKMENANGKSFSIAPDTEDTCHGSCKGNPATNEWIPSGDDDGVAFSSAKPNRSDN